MSTHFLRILAQRRQVSALTAEAPTRPELDRIVEAVMGHHESGKPLPWRLVGTKRSEAPELAAALSGLKNIPDPTSTARIKGKHMRRLAAFRGSLAFASRGGLALAVIFSPDSSPELPKKIQRAEALASRHLLEAAFFATGWATQWAPRRSADPAHLGKFYDLSDNEEILGWLFIGRPEHGLDSAATIQPKTLPIRMR